MKLKLFKFAVVTAIAGLFMTACSMDEPSNTPLLDNSDTETNFISLSEALENAENEFKLVYGNQTRSGREVKDFEVFKATTRSEGDSLNGFYIVNYDEGFAMLSADRRRPAVFAISDEGSLHLSDTINNKGLSQYINKLAITIRPPFDPGKPDTTIHKWEPPVPYEKEKVVISERLLTGFMSKFHQMTPYNQYCPLLNMTPTYVGCLPLAVGTVIGYYKWPNACGGTNVLHWDSMVQNAYHDDWAHLFEVLGRKDYLNANYGTLAMGGTGATLDGIERTFSNMRYKGTKIANFSQTVTDDELKHNNPVVVTGRTQQNTTGRDTGHAWVIDGAYYTIETNQISFGDKYIYKYYYHCVWGFGGDANGYFLYDIKSPRFGGTPEEADSGTSGSCNVYKELTVIYGYRPNK